MLEVKTHPLVLCRLTLLLCCHHIQARPMTSHRGAGFTSALNKKFDPLSQHLGSTSTLGGATLARKADARCAQAGGICSQGAFWCHAGVTGLTLYYAFIYLSNLVHLGAMHWPWPHPGAWGNTLLHYFAVPCVGPGPTQGLGATHRCTTCCTPH